MESAGLTHLLVVYHINRCTCADSIPYKKSYHGSLVTNAQNEDAYTTQVQMSMSTVPMQQVWPERSQNASDKQQTM